MLVSFNYYKKYRTNWNWQYDIELVELISFWSVKIIKIQQISLISNGYIIQCYEKKNPKMLQHLKSYYFTSSCTSKYLA